VRGWLQRSGVHAEIGALAIECGAPACRLKLTVHPLDVTLEGLTRARIDTLDVCALPAGADAQNVYLQVGDPTPFLRARLARASYRLSEARLDAERVRILEGFPEEGELGSVSTLAAEGPKASHLAKGVVRLESVLLGQSTWRVPADLGPADACGAAQGLAGAADLGFRRLSEIVSRARRLVVFTAWLVGATLILLKLWLVSHVRLPVRLIVAVAPVVAVAAASRYTGFLPTLTIATSGAILLFLVVYRAASVWLRRWAPLVLDFTTPLLLWPLAAALAAFPRLAPSLDGIEIARIESRGSEVEGVSLPETEAREVVIRIGGGALNAVTVQDLVSQGRIEAPRLAEELGRLRYLPERLKTATGLNVCLGAQVAEVVTALPELHCRPSAETRADVSATVSFDPAACKARFLARAALSPIALTWRGKADKEAIDLDEVKSLPGSRLVLSEGRGRLDGQSARLSAEGVRWGAGSGETSAAVGSAAASLAWPAPDVWTWKGNLADISTGSFRAAEIALDGAARAGQHEIVMETRDLELSASGVRVEAPRVRTRVAAEALPGPGFIPERVRGRASLELRGAEVDRFHSDRPIVFDVSLHEGRGSLTARKLQIRQTVFPGVGERLTLDAAAGFRLDSLEPVVRASLEATCGVSQVAFALHGLGATLKNLEGSASVSWQGERRSNLGVLRLEMRDLTVPEIPAAVTLEEVGDLDLSARLEASSTRHLPDLRRVIQELRGSFPSTDTWRVDVAWPVRPGVPLARLRPLGSDAGVSVKDLTWQSALLRVRDARLETVEASALVSGVQTLAGEGRFDLDTQARLDGDHLETHLSHRPAPGGASWLDGRLALGARELGLSVSPLRLEPLAPLARALGIAAEGVRFQALIEPLNVRASLESSKIVGLDLEVRVAPGAIASFDLPSLRAEVTSNGLRAILSPLARPRGTAATLELQKLEVRAPEFKAELDGSVPARIDWRGEDEPSPLTRTLAQVREGLARHLEPGPLLPETTFENVHVAFNLGPQAASRPAFRLLPDRAETSILVSQLDVGWDGARARSRTRGALGLDLDLFLHGESLVADGLVAPEIAIETGTEPTCLTGEIPFLVAFSEDIPPDPDSIWKAVEPRWGGRTGRPLELERLVVGPVSLLQIAFPSAPLRAHIGFRERLALYLPLSADVLFGSARGLLQASLGRRDGEVDLDAAAELGLQSIQASAVGAASADGHVPILEDTLQGSLRAGVRSLRSLDLLDAAEKLDLDLKLESAVPEMSGLIHAGTDVRVDTLNEILNALALRIELSRSPARMTYGTLCIDVGVRRGQIETTRPAVEIRQLVLPAYEGAELVSNWRFHAERPGPGLSLKEVVRWIQSAAAAQSRPEERR